MRSAFRIWTFLLVLLLPALATAQGLLVDVRENHAYRLPRPQIIPGPRPPRIRPPRPPRPQSYKIKELAIRATLTDQIGNVQISQTFVNTGSRQMEVCFVFPLPYNGAVDRLTFMVDGKEYEAELLSADEARRIYESYVRRNQDPALMEWIGTGMFKTSVFPVPPGAERTVSLRYNQICRKQGGLTEILFPLSTAKYTSHPVEEVTIQVSIQSEAKIKNIYSPTHSVDIKRPGNRRAKVTYRSSREVPTSDFRLMYDIGSGKVGASLLSYRPNGKKDGYFLLLVSPEIKNSSDQAVKKTVLFVVDRSGSMSGKKIEQAQDALRFVLNNLNEGDLFNIIAYDSAVESFQPELQRFDDRSRQAALGFVESIYAGGSTNIDGALQAALAQLQDDRRPSYIVFLTDGLPTSGEKNVSRIAENARKQNDVRARLFPFGVGFDVNSRLLDRLARDGFGQSQYVRPSEDIEEHVSRLYKRIGAPVMTDLSITFDMEDFPAERGSLANRVYPRNAYDLFAGDQLVVVGRFKRGGRTRVTVKGKVEGKVQSFDFPAKFTRQSPDETYAFVEKLWAMRRVGEIIDEIDLHGKNQELIDELVALSTKHGILTPYTSFLADDDANIRDLATSRRRAGFALEALRQEAGRGGFLQRDYKSTLQRAAQAPAAGAVKLRILAEDREVQVDTVKQVGGKTFFFRNGRWVDSTLTDEQEKAAEHVKRYSAEYFQLVSRFGNPTAKYLAMEGDITVVLDGRAYVLSE
ncbi:MAG: VIT domain-containing protein [Pirellulaceae bacterium]